MRTARIGTLGLLAAVSLGAAPVPAAEPAGVSITVGKDRIDFRHRGALTATYHIGPDVAKPYFWPLNDPDGQPLTRPWPMVADAPGEKKDHPHQKSAWFCHGDVIPEGVEVKHKIRGVEGVDFWSEAKGHGRIVCTKVEPPHQEKDHGWVTTHNEWRTADGMKVLDETRTIHFYDFGGAQLLVLDIDLGASVVPITFGDTKEGSMGVRVRQSLNADRPGKGTLTNADGKVGEKGPNGCWGRISAWCDDSGPVDGKTAGVAIFADPRNAVPSCWHARGYGLVAANPFGRDRSGFPDMKGNHQLVKLAKGEHLKLRYGLFLHRGDAKEAKVADYYERFMKRKG
jgi:Methane oxygenase PmoA